MSKSRDQAKLAEALAAIAISSLGGPIPATGTALTQAAKLARHQYLKTADTRDLQRNLTEALTTWANTEHLTPGAVEQGLLLATETINTHGPNPDQMATLDYNPTRISEAVIKQGQASDPYWMKPYQARDELYTAAERAIHETYATLTRQIHEDDDATLTAVLNLKATLQTKLDQIHTDVNQLTQHPTQPETAGPGGVNVDMRDHAHIEQQVNIGHDNYGPIHLHPPAPQPTPVKPTSPIAGFQDLDPDPSERAHARQALLHTITNTTDPQQIRDLTSTLQGLDPTPAELAQARQALLHAFINTDL